MCVCGGGGGRFVCPELTTLCVCGGGGGVTAGEERFTPACFFKRVITHLLQQCHMDIVLHIMMDHACPQRSQHHVTGHDQPCMPPSTMQQIMIDHACFQHSQNHATAHDRPYNRS